MKKTHCFIIFFISLLSLAQEKNTSDLFLESYNKGVEFFNIQNWEDALVEFEIALNYEKDIDFTENKDYYYFPANTHYYYGLCNFHLGKFEFATSYFIKTAELLSQIQDVDMNFVKQVLNDIVAGYENYDLNKAIEFNKKILEGISQTDGVESIAYAEQLFKSYLLNRNNDGQEQAIKNLEEAYTIHKKIGNTNHEQYSVIVFNLAYTHFHKENYASAISYFKDAEKMASSYKKIENINFEQLIYDYAVSLYRERLYKEAEEQYQRIADHPYFNSKENAERNLYLFDGLASSIFYQERPEEAKRIYQKSMAHLRTILGAFDSLYALQKTNYTRLLITLEDYKQALIESNETFAIFEETKDFEAQAYLNVVNNLGLIYLRNSEFDRAEEFLKKSLTLAQSQQNPNQADIIVINTNLANLYRQRGKLEDASVYFKKIINGAKEIYPKTSSEYAQALMNYGIFLYETGQYEASEPYILESMKITEDYVGTQNIIYAKKLINLGQYCLFSRQLKRGLSAFNQAISIYEKLNLKNSLDIALALESKSKCLIALNDKENALNTGLKAQSIIENLLGKTSNNYAGIAKSLGDLYLSNDQPNKAFDNYNTAFKIYQKNYETGHPVFGDILASYIEGYMTYGQYKEALGFIESLELNRIKNFGIESYNYGQVLYTKANVLMNLDDTEGALNYYEIIKPIFDKHLDSNSDLYSRMLIDYGTALDFIGKKQEAYALYTSYVDGLKSQLKDVFTYRNENDKKKFLKGFQTNLNWLNATLYEAPQANKELMSTCINNQLVLKSLLLNASKDIMSKLTELNSPELNQKIEKYKRLRQLTAQPNTPNLKNLKKEMDFLATDLNITYNNRLDANASSNFDRDWKVIKNKLEQNELAIEFLSFSKRVNNKLSEDLLYGAFLVHKDWDLPKAITLFNEKDLKILLEDATPNQLYKTRGAKGASTTNTKGLYELIWKPLEEHLNGIETVYYSPSGLLNQIPFAALDTEDQPILAERYNLVQLSSTYVLTEEQSNPKQNSTLFVGGINYESNSVINSKSNEVEASIALLKNTSGTRSLGSSWNYLPGTLQEIEQLQLSFKNQNTSFSILSGKEATEIAFKNLSGNSPNVIHIATHGFFFENPKESKTSTLDIASKNVYKQSEDPLLRSGLIFAGANEAWVNGGKSNAKDDGILTALEISNLDLSNTDMVVLSACETGLGDIDGSEGVYGLQRAFKMAGVDIIVMSLWEVPDAETSEFMTLFYINWLNGQDVRKAFRNTQLAMAETYKDNPEKWAAFVLFE